MGFWKDYWERRVTLTASDSVATLSAMERFFQDGRNWTRGAYHNHLTGSKCLVGAAQAMKQGAIEDARYWLRQAILERHPGLAWLPVMTIEAFNDSRLSFDEIAAVIARAKELAIQHYRQAHAPPAPVRLLPAPAPVVEIPLGAVDILPPERVAVKRRD